MKLRIQAGLEPRCVAFLQRKLEQFDTSRLEYVRLYDRTGQTDTHGVWGRCTFPNRKKQIGYRIRCCVSITAREFPYPAKWAIGTRRLDDRQWEWVWREDKFFTKEETFVWLAGHEAFHWLRHSRQVPGANYETQANRCGFTWLDEWRLSAASAANDDHSKSLRPQAGCASASDNARKARIYFADGHVESFSNQVFTFALWSALPKGVRAAFRGANDTRPVYPWDCVDAL